MSNRKWDRFCLWIARTIAEILPESVKRQVLYELIERAAHRYSYERSSAGAVEFDYETLTIDELCRELRD